MKKSAQKLLVGTIGAAGVLLAASTTANADSTISHKVKQNETVWALSQKYGVSIQSIEHLNRINSNHLIITGQTLQIPSKFANTSDKRTYTIKSGDTLWNIAKNNNISLNELVSLNNLNVNDIIYPGQILKLSTNTSANDTKVVNPASNNTSSSKQNVTKVYEENTAKIATTPKVSESVVNSSSTTVNVTKAEIASNSSVDTTNFAQKIQYTIKSGDSLYVIAQKFGVTIDSLRTNNNLGATLLPGQILTIVNPTKQPSETPTTNDTHSNKQSIHENANSSNVANNTDSSRGSVTTSTQSSNTTRPVNATNKNVSNTTTTSVQQPSSTHHQTNTAINVTTPSNTASGSSIVSYAQSFKGVPYVWGGTTPSGFDCSGLVQYVYSHYGINLPRVTTSQENSGTLIPVSQAQPGDLYFWGAKGSSYHVAIAMGGGSFIHAPEPGDSVKIGNVQYFQPSFAVRVLK